MSDTETKPDENKDDPKELRAQLEAANRERAEHAAKLEAYQSDEKLVDAGFGHLNKTQRRAILRDLKEDGKEIDKDTAAEVAQGYGFPTEPSQPAPTVTNPAPTNGDPNQVNDGVDESMGAFSAMERAQRAAVAGQTDATLEAEIRKTNSPEELTSLIRTKGPRSGLVHSWDVE